MTLLTRISRRGVAALLSLSLVLGTAAPVAAYDGRTEQDRRNAQAAQIIGGLIALGVIAKLANDRNDERDRRRSERRKAEARLAEAQRLAEARRARAPIVEPGRRGHGVGAVIPARCVAEVGSRRVVGAPCLRRQGVRIDAPRRCETEFYLGGRYRPGYLVRCLRRAGYTIR